MSVVGEHPQYSVTEVAVAGGKLFAVGPFALVRFEPGADPVPLLERERLFASLAVDDTHVYAALINEGTIFAIPLAGGEPELLAKGRERPLQLFRRRAWLGWIEQPFITDPVRGPPYSSNRTILCALPTGGGPVQELATHEGGGWDPAIAGDRLAWVRPRAGARPEIVSMSGGLITPLITELGEPDESAGFVHLAGSGEHFIVAIPSKTWLRKGVELRRHGSEGELIEIIDFVPGHFNGLDADETGIALAVEQGNSIVVTAWDRAGKARSMKVPRQPGPLVRVHVAADGVYFPVGRQVHRLDWV